MRKARIFLGAMFLIIAIACGACAAYGFMVSSEPVDTASPDYYTYEGDDKNTQIQNSIADNSSNLIALITKVGNFENTILILFTFTSVIGALTFFSLSIFNFAASGEGYVKKSEQQQYPQYSNTGVYQIVPTSNTGVYPVVSANTGVYPVVQPVMQQPIEQAPTVQESAEPVKEKKAKKEEKKEENKMPVKESNSEAVQEEAEATKESDEIATSEKKVSEQTEEKAK